LEHKGIIATLIGVGALLAIWGVITFENTACNCPGQVLGQPNTCVCLPSPEAYFSFFAGLFLVLAGTGYFFRLFSKQ
jgi:hypothetical protein